MKDILESETGCENVFGTFQSPQSPACKIMSGTEQVVPYAVTVRIVSFNVDNWSHVQMLFYLQITDKLRPESAQLVSGRGRI